MKKYLFLLSILFVQLVLRQSVDFKKIKYNGLAFYSTKDEIVRKLGNPKKIFNPNYECGFLSGDEQGDEYLTLDYGKIKYTGNTKEKFLLEKINFEDKKVVLFYGKDKLTNETTSKQLSRIFGKKFKENGSYLIPCIKGDDGIKIELKNGKLIRMEYWSPC